MGNAQTYRIRRDVAGSHAGKPAIPSCGPMVPSSLSECSVCAFQKTIATMDLCGVGWECGEKANGDPATGNACEKAPRYQVWTGGHDYGGTSNYHWLLLCAALRPWFRDRG
ncbi:uncharacterized protein N7496_002866 [Penicillium cataractarum]|uniref:Uncharacterized protein n=1 Tax=Penicillium cataractarum TaxID=2100454 RepID=A0A9W9VFM9_9EURO|nr:uncharacterized protein N7496_002866 [Penicillium cataractarum]KAJ5380438.1 hypothetical protein N7496_002866 [Penicillium cataractarum]